jgi:HEAT repeat protein
VADDTVDIVKRGAEPPPRSTEEAKPAERDEALTVFRALEKTLGTIQLYPENSKIRVQFIDDFARRIIQFLEEYEELNLNVRDDRILYKDVTLYEEPIPAKSLSMMLYRDGVRKLTLYRGIDRQEVADLLDVLALQPDADDLEDDIVTLLWEKDFSHVSYFIFEETDDLSASDFAKDLKRGDEEQLLFDAHEGKYLAPKLSASAMSDIMTITDHDIGSIKAMIAQENSRNLHHDLTTLLFEMLSLRADVRSFGNSARVLVLLVGSYLRAGTLVEATEVLRRLRALQQENLPETHAEIIQEQIAEIRSTETLELVEKILDKPFVEDAEQLIAFLRLLGPAILKDLLDLLPRVRSRHHLTELLAEFGKEQQERLLEHVSHEDSSVVQQIVQVLGALGDPGLATQLQPVLEHPALAVRLEAVKALGRLGGTEANSCLLRAIRDSEYQVRILALRALKEHADPAFMTTLVELVDEKGFQRNRYELQELLCSIARVGGEAAFPYLKDLLEKRTWWFRTKNRELRVCAAAALGCIPSDLSRELLEKHSRIGPIEIREPCRLAVQRFEMSEPTDLESAEQEVE